MKEYQKYLKEVDDPRSPFAMFKASEREKSAPPDYQEIASANILKLDNALKKAREAAETIGLAANKGAKVDIGKIIAKVRQQARWMIEEIDHEV
jgi:hypothetical protein